MTVFSDNVEWSATVAAALVCVGPIIKLPIGITLRRFNRALWLRTSFPAVAGPRLSAAVTACETGPAVVVCHQRKPILKEQMKCGPLNAAIHAVIASY